jgi:CheY-like chemotaxis protein
MSLNGRGPAPAASPAVRVLVVDDNPALRRLGHCVFEALGCQVWTAEDGQEAVRLAQALPFEIVMLDRHMPVCGGDAAASQIRETGRARSMLVSHSSDPPRGRAAGLYDVVAPKPAQVADIANLVTLARRAPCALAA